MRVAAAVGVLGALLAVDARLEKQQQDAAISAGIPHVSLVDAAISANDRSNRTGAGDQGVGEVVDFVVDVFDPLPGGRPQKARVVQLAAGTAPAQLVQGRTVEEAVEAAASGIAKIVFGLLFLAIAVPIHWFNEERSARLSTLLVYGRSQCVSLSGDEPRESDRGRLVHVQGRAKGVVPLTDHQLPGATVKGALKLQSTVEVYEWSQRLKTWMEGPHRKTQPRFQQEWTTAHVDTRSFKGPSPENPRLPAGLALGTTTQACPRIQLGGFVLTEDMVRHLHKFEPAMPHLPDKLTAHLSSKLVFYADRQDGYYYARPGAGPGTARSGPRPYTDHQVGDVRVRFMHVPETDATVVGVQCQRDSCDSFVPFRPISRALWDPGDIERQKLLEEGDRPFRDLKREASCCCTGGVASCCFCSCNAIAHCCKEEVITEEIFHVSDQLDPKEKAFEHVVQRNPCRVWNFRLLGSCVMFWGVGMIIGSMQGTVLGSLGVIGAGVNLTLLTVVVTLAAHALIVAVAYSCYNPLAAFQWYCVAATVLAAPLLVGELT